MTNATREDMENLVSGSDSLENSTCSRWELRGHLKVLLIKPECMFPNFLSSIQYHLFTLHKCGSFF